MRHFTKALVFTWIMVLGAMFAGMAQMTINTYKDSVITIQEEDFSDAAPTEILALAGEDEVYLVPLPFSFQFFSNTYTEMYVSINGNVSFGQSYAGQDFNREKLCYPVQSLYNPAAGQDAANPDNFIGVYWDDLFLDGTCTANGPAQLVYRTIGTEPNRQFIVGWESFVRSADGPACVTDPAYSGLLQVQLRLYEGSNIIEVHLIQNNLQFEADETEKPTIGVENADASYANFVVCGTDDFAPQDGAWRFTPSSEPPKEGPSGPYCDAEGLCSDSTWITRVTLANIDNSSGCVPVGYSDFTNMTAVLEPGAQYQLTVEPGNLVNAAMMVYAWIDFNGDSIFSPDEEIPMAGNPWSEIAADVGFQGVVIAPDSATGLTRLRVRLSWQRDGGTGLLTSNDTPCGPDDVGEVEDYHIFVGDSTASGNDYCMAQGTPNCEETFVSGTDTIVLQVFIDSVAIQNDNGTLGNPSACERYGDFTDMISPVTPGSVYQIAFHSNDNNLLATGSFWIDWDNNKQFDTGEETNMINTDGENYISAFTVPLDAADGIYRLRIRLGGNTPPAPCGEDFEAEDYSLLVGTLLGCVSHTVPADDAVVCPDRTTLHWNTVTDATGYRVSLEYGTPPVSVISDQSVNDTTITIPGGLVADTTYRWIVIPFNDNQESMGCDTLTFTTTTNPQVVVFNDQDTVTCNGDNIQLLGNVTPGTPPYIYTWSGTSLGKLDDPSVQNPVFTADQNGLFTYGFSVSDDNGCASDTDNVTIEVLGGAIAGTIAADKSALCEGELLTFNWTGYAGSPKIEVSTDGGVTWTDASVTQVDAETFTLVPASGSYLFRGVALAGNCSDTTSATTTVDVNPVPDTPVLAMNGPTSICPNESTQIVVTNYTDNITWNDPAQTANDTLTVDGVKGDFAATYTDPVTGCQVTSDTQTIVSLPAPSKSTIQLVNDSLFSLESGDQYKWFRDGVLISFSAARKIVPPGPGNYTVIVINSDGCESPESDPFFYSSVGENKLLNDYVTVVPNPNNGSFRIALDQAAFNAIKLISTTGQTVYERAVSGTDVEVRLPESVAPGIYVMQLTGGNSNLAIVRVEIMR